MAKNTSFRWNQYEVITIPNIYEFETTTEWQSIEIPITELYASFRGRTVDFPNYDGTNLEEIAFLVGNKKNETFELIIDKIEVK